VLGTRSPRPPPTAPTSPSPLPPGARRRAWTSAGSVGLVRRRRRRRRSRRRRGRRRSGCSWPPGGPTRASRGAPPSRPAGRRPCPRGAGKAATHTRARAAVGFEQTFTAANIRADWRSDQLDPARGAQQPHLDEESCTWVYRSLLDSLQNSRQGVCPPLQSLLPQLLPFFTQSTPPHPLLTYGVGEQSASRAMSPLARCSSLPTHPAHVVPCPRLLQFPAHSVSPASVPCRSHTTVSRESRAPADPGGSTRLVCL
jgi:hypothetical protein